MSQYEPLDPEALSAIESRQWFNKETKMALIIVFGIPIGNMIHSVYEDVLFRHSIRSIGAVESVEIGGCRV